MLRVGVVSSFRARWLLARNGCCYGFAGVSECLFKCLSFVHSVSPQQRPAANVPDRSASPSRMAGSVDGGCGSGPSDTPISLRTSGSLANVCIIWASETKEAKLWK